MTDDPTTDVPDQPDERDERVAELLEVPPLDDVTRRRLVSRALDAADDGSGTGAATPPGAPRGRRILAVAAGAVAVIAVGAGVISALRDDGGSGSTTVAGQAEYERSEDAAPSTGGAGDPGAAEAPAPTAPATPRASASSVPIDLGDLGDVGDTARLRATVRGALAGGDAQARYLQDALGAPCSAAAPAGTSTVAVGSGRDQGTPVVVLVVAEELDRFRLLRLDPTTCAVRSDDRL